MDPITVGGRQIYAAWTRTGRGLRVRLATEEVEWLGLFAGQVVPVGTRGEGPTTHHVLSVVPVGTGWTCVELLRAVDPSAERRGPSSERDVHVPTHATGTP